MIDVLLTAAAPVIEDALRRLLQTPKSVRPFVIIEELSSKKFVQFAGSDEEELLFDVPSIGISFRVPNLGGFSGIADMAIQTLTEHLWVPTTATLRITESNRNSGEAN